MTDNSSQLDLILHELDEMQALEIKVIDVKEQTSVTDYMIIASGRSSRHVKAIAQSVLEKVKQSGLPPLSANGLDSGDWALVDFGDYVLHVMQADTRSFYNLEGLWEDGGVNK